MSVFASSIFVRQRLLGHCPAAKNTHATIEEFLTHRFLTGAFCFKGKQGIGSTQNFLPTFTFLLLLLLKEYINGAGF
jgi:hypothetical protein